MTNEEQLEKDKELLEGWEASIRSKFNLKFAKRIRILNKPYDRFDYEHYDIEDIDKFYSKEFKEILAAQRRVVEREMTLKLNDLGQCPICEIKPLTYKREHMLFCHRCDRAFNDKTGNMIANFAYEGNIKPTETNRLGTVNMLIVDLLDQIAEDLGVDVVDFRNKYLHLKQQTDETN